MAQFPADWLDPRAGGVATDLDLAVLLVNTYDRLEDPPDRLYDLRWLTGVLSDVGHEAIAGALTDGDLPGLQRLREGLRATFESTDLAAAALVLNPMLSAAEAVPQLVTSPEGARLDVGVGRRGLASLEARLPMAVAEHLVGSGVARLGTCASDPCGCAFVDRTRAGTRRYCCSWCNDRAAARAYRRRQRSAAEGI